MKVIFATRNQGKLDELSTLTGSKLEILSPSEAGVPKNFDVEETGRTFEENAILKAKGFAKKSKLSAIADDSGLQVDILNGFPEIKSARWLDTPEYKDLKLKVGGGKKKPATAEERTQAILELIKKDENRRARFVSVVCLFNQETKETNCFLGEVEGMLAKEPKGENGFGYDPIFIPNGFKKTFGELDDKVKGSFSHRARAFGKMVKWLSAQEKLA